MLLVLSISHASRGCEKTEVVLTGFGVRTITVTMLSEEVLRLTIGVSIDGVSDPLSDLLFGRIAIVVCKMVMSNRFSSVRVHITANLGKRGIAVIRNFAELV